MKTTDTSFNQMIIFHAVAQERSIRGASRKLGIAPPSVSNSLKSLETKLGVLLFRRSTRKLALTEAGSFLLTHSKEAMNSLDNALEGVKEFGKSPSGKVSITLPRFVYQCILRPIFPAFCHSYPNIELEISIADKAINLLDEDIDVGIRFGHLIEEGVIAHKLTEPMAEALFASPEYVEKNGMPLTPSDLASHQLIQYRFGGSNKIASLLLNDRGNVLQIDSPSALVVNDTDVMIDAALSGIGIGRVLTPSIQSKIQSGQLIPILPEYWYHYPSLYLYFSRHSQSAQKVRVLIDFLLENSQIQEQ